MNVFAFPPHDRFAVKLERICGCSRRSLQWVVDSAAARDAQDGKKTAEV